MKATGIIRNIDELGRIVIPKELRKKMDIKSDDPIEIYVEEDRIILEKFTTGCLFCDSDTDIQIYKGKKICAACLQEMSRL